MVSSVLTFALNMGILLTGLVYFRISYHFSGPQNQNRLTWLLWGLVGTIALYAVQLFLLLLYPDMVYLRVGVYVLTSLVVCLSFIFFIFFSGSTDARIVMRKTILYSAVFLSGLFLFGAVEHYVIHVLAHALHVQSSFLSSCLGAAIALLARPLHHRVEHWLDHWEEDQKVQAEQGSEVPVARQTTRVVRPGGAIGKDRVV
jgi:hypothetical protein